MRSGGLEQLRQRQVQEQKLQGYEGQLKQQSKEVAKVEQQVQQQQAQIDSANKEASEWEQAQKLAAKGVRPTGQSGVADKLRKIIQGGYIDPTSMNKYQTELKQLTQKENLTAKDLSRIDTLAGLTGAEIKYTTTGGTTSTTEMQGMSVNPFFAKGKTISDLRGEITNPAGYATNPLKADITRYSKAGYSPKESEALAKYSSYTQTTPSPEVAQKYLKGSLMQDIRYTPSSGGLLSKGSYKLQQASEIVGSNIRYFGARVGERIIPNNVKVSQLVTLGSAGFLPFNILQSQDLKREKYVPATQANINTINKSNISNQTYPVSDSINKPNDNRYLNFFSRTMNKEFTGEQIGSTAADVGSYFIPYFGVARFRLDVGAMGSKGLVSGIEITKTKGIKSLPGETWKWAKENPAEATFAGIVVGVGAYKILKEPISKLSPNYIKQEKTGIKFVEDYTIPRSKEYLQSFEGKSARQIHITQSPELKYGSTLTAKPEMAEGWRKQLEQFSFYTSAPEKLPKGAQKPTAYLAYAGVGKSYSPTSKVEFTLFESPVKAFISSGEISKTPKTIKSLSAKEIISYQSSKAGKTFVAGENIKGISREGQFVTSVANPEKGFIGTKILETEGPLSNKFTYYVQHKQTPKIIESIGLSKPYDILTRKNIKVNFYESSFVPATGIQSVSAAPLKSVDIVDYSSSYGKTKYVSLSSLTPKISSAISGSSNSNSIEYTSNIPKSTSSSISSPSKTKVSYSFSKSVSSSLPSSITSISSPSSSINSLPQISSYPSIGSSSSSLRTSSSQNYSSQGKGSSSKINSYKPSSIPSIRRTSIPKTISSQAYQLQLRRQGKFSTIAEGLTKGEALRLGVKRTTGTLAQTFRLLPKGTTQKENVEYKLPTDIFTKLKKPTAELEWVEMRGKTLKRGTGEVPEIMSTKRIKGRRNFL